MNTQDIDSNIPRQAVKDPTLDMSKSKALAFPECNTGMTLSSAVVEVVNTRRWNNLLHRDDDDASVASSIKVGVLIDPNDHEEVEEEEELYFFPALQRAESFPLSCHSAPPRRPSRSGSFESKDIVSSSSRRAQFLSKAVSSAKEDSEDEIDHRKFRRLLLGRGLSSSSRDGDDGNDSDDSRPMNDILLTSLRYQKSASSAPPKLPNRTGSDSEDATQHKQVRRTTTAPCGRQKSLPMAVFRPQPVRRRRRSRMQDMIDSENGSSMATPPRLPSRTGSDRSNSSMTGKSDIAMPGVLMLCPSTPGSKSSTTDAPRRPRRSLSPMCSSTIHSLFNNATMMDDADSLEGDKDLEIVDMVPVMDNLPEGEPETPVLLQKDPSPVTAAKGHSQVRKIRKLPGRAKTFSFHTKKIQLLEDEPVLLVTKAPTRNTSCVSLLSTGMMSKGDENTVKSLEDQAPPSIADLQTSMESIFSSQTWPIPRRTRVTPGRSRTFSFYQNRSASTSRS